MSQTEDVLSKYVTAPIHVVLSTISERARSVYDLFKTGQDTKQAIEQFNYYLFYFNELDQVLGTLLRPYEKDSLDIPFDKEVLKRLMDSLKIPACPPILLKTLHDQYKETGKIDFSNFKKAYGDEFKREFEGRKDEYEELRKARTENFSNYPYSKSFDYWNKLPTEGMFIELLRWKTLELLLPSAGEKRLDPKFLQQVYKSWQELERETKSN